VKPAAPTARDGLLLAAIVTIALVEAVLRPELPPAFVAVGIAIMPTVLWRRTRPLSMVAIAFGVSIVLGMVRLTTAAEVPLPHAMAFLVVLPYALVRWGSRFDIAIGTGIIALSAALGFLADRAPVGDVFGGTAVLLAVIAAGAAVRYRARARAQEIEQAKSREREQIARDLHDTVAHHVSAIAIRAQAGLATPPHPDTTTDALRDIAAEASLALADMRRMVRVLRTDGSVLRAPTPGIADLESLDDAVGGGPRVALSVSGDANRLTATVASAVYRLAQEAVTNARRHATGATLIQIELDVSDTVVRLEVTDDGDALQTRGRDGAAYGLVGMAERAEMLGGTFDAGPGPEQGWRVRAMLPRHALNA
jgi:signal transduction histidine kinase